MQFGLSSCSADEFQLEMRRVKFLLDYQGAREFEYRLAREWRSVTKMKTREGVSSFSPVCHTPCDFMATVDADLRTSFLYLRPLFNNGMQVHSKTFPHLHFLSTSPMPWTFRSSPYPGFQAICY